MEKDVIAIHIMNPQWTIKAQPPLRIFKGGHQAKAGEWFLEVQRVLFDIYQSFKAIENFINRGNQDLFVGKNKTKIEISDTDRTWVLGYVIDNAYLRIDSCLDKIAQMVLVHYNHPNHGGDLLLQQRCGKCPPSTMTEKNCTFGSLVRTLHENGRDSEIDNALFSLEESKILAQAKKARNNISHRINKNIFYPGLDPSIKLEISGDIQRTTFIFGEKLPSINEYRHLIADAHNEITQQLNIIGPIIFPAAKNY